MVRLELERVLVVVVAGDGAVGRGAPDSKTTAPASSVTHMQPRAARGIRGR